MSLRAIDLNPGRVRGTGRPSLGQVLGSEGGGDEVDAVLDHTFWRAPTTSPLRLVWSADLVRGRLEQR